MTMRLFGQRKNRIAIVKIEGVIAETEMLVGSRAKIIAALKEAQRRRVRAIVLRINSPGGTVAACQEVYGTIARLKEKGIPVVASMGDVAASGGVYVAMAASEIVANPGTVTGSIGVIIRSTNLIHLYEKIGIEPKVIKSGRHKDMLATYRSFSDEEKILLQTVIDDSHRQFVEAVSESRAKSLASVEQIADGRIMTGRQALESGLVDHLGDLEFAIERARSLAGLPGQPRLIYVRIRRGRLQRLFNRMAEYTSGLPTGAGLKGLPLWMLPTA